MSFNPYAAHASKSRTTSVAKSLSTRQRALSKRFPVVVTKYPNAAEAPRVEVVRTGFEVALYL